jgi:hypothetical protein
LTGSGIRTGESSKEWKGYNPTKSNRHWAVPVKPVENIVGKEKAVQLSSIEKLDILLENNLVEFTKNGTPSFKRYLDASKGNLIGNIWTDIQNVQAVSKEKIGYPTQKPEALLQRIIEMASNEGDLVLDPFMGGGTTVAVADKLNRKWTGIDQSVQAVKVTELRLDRQRDLFSAPFTVQLHKYDYDTLRYRNAFEFESFIITQFCGVPQNKKGGDKGVDGKTTDGTPIQVKRSDSIVRDVVDKFPVAAKRYDSALFDKNIAAGKPVGYIIAFSFSRGAIEEVARLRNRENIIIELKKVEDIVPIAKKPAVKVGINELSRDAKGVMEIEFTTTGQSEAGIEFYSWDFEYVAEKGFKAGVMLDREGKQTCRFKAGLHTVAVKAVDNDGLEGIEVIKLKVNGTVERQ